MSEQIGSGHIDVNYDVDDSALTRSFAKMKAAQNDHWAGYKKLVNNSLNDTDKNWDNHLRRQMSGLENVGKERQRILDNWVKQSAKPLPNIHQAVELDTSKAKYAAARLNAEMDQLIKDKHTKVDLDTMAANLKIQRLEADLKNIHNPDIHAQFDDAAAKIKIAEIKLKLAEIHDKRVEVKVDVDRSWSSRIGGVFRAITGMGRRSGDDTGRDMAGGVARGLLSILPAQTEKIFGSMGGPAGMAFMAALTAAIGVGLPAIGAMIGGTLMAVVGSAGLAAAFAAVWSDPRIKSALKGLKDQFMGIFDQKTKDFIVNQFAPAFNTISNSLKNMAPYIQQIVKAGSTFAGPVANGLKMFAEGILPPLAKLMGSNFMKDIMNIFSQGFGRVGQTLGDFFTKFLNDPKAMEGAKKGLNDLFDLINWLIKTAGDFIIKMSEFWDSITKKGPDGKSTLDNIKDVLRDIKTVITDVIGLAKQLFDALGGNKAFIDQLKQEKTLFDQLTGHTDPNADDNGKGPGKGRKNMPGDSFPTRAKKFGQNKWDDIKGGGDVLPPLTPTDFIVKALQPQLDKAQHVLFDWGKRFGHEAAVIFDSVRNHVHAAFSRIVNDVRHVFDQVRGYLHAAFSSIVNDTRHAFDQVRGRIHAAFSSAVNDVKHAWDLIVNNVLSAMKNIQNWIGNALNWIRNIWNFSWNWIKATASNVWNAITAALSAFWSWVTNAFNASLAWVRNTWNTAWHWVHDTAVNIWNAIVSALQQFWNWVQNAFNAALNWIRSIWNDSWTWVHNTAINVWNAIRNALAQFWDWIQNAFNAALNWIKQTWNDAWNAVKQFFMDTWNSIWDWIQHRWEDIKNLFNQALAAIKQGWNDAWDGMHKAFVAVWDKIKAAGADGMNGLIDHINSGVNAINGVIGKLGLDFKIPTIDHVGGGGPPGHADGGAIRGSGTGTSDGELAYLSHNEHVWTAREVDSFGGHRAMEDFRHSVLHGFATGGSPATKDGLRAYAGGGITSTQDAIIAVARKSGIPFTVNSAFRPGSVSLSGNADYHSRGMAVDFGSPNMPGLAAFFMRYAGSLLEEIHSSGGGFFVKNGHRVGNSYYGNEVAGHFDHVHIAATLAAMEGILGGKVAPGEGGGGLMGFINEFVSKGWGWVMGNMLSPAFDKLTGGWPMTGVSQIGRGAAEGMKKVFMKKIKDLFDEALAAASSVGGGGPNSGAVGSQDVMKQAYETAKSMGADDKVMMALFEAGFVESGFRNLQTATDHDSLGFLQQRPSAGWPSPLNVPTATRSFVSRAMAAESRASTPGQLAQMVQVSAFPGRYDQMAGRARAALNSIMAVVAGAVSKIGSGVAKQAGNVVGKVHGLKFDNGGYIPPNSFAYNGSSVPELALNGAQGDALRKKIEGIGSGGGNVIKVYIDGVEVAQRRVTVEEIDKNNHALFEHITKL